MEAKRIKKYVQVTADFFTDGRLRPLLITWEDGRKFRIDKIKDIRRAASLKRAEPVFVIPAWSGGRSVICSMKKTTNGLLKKKLQPERSWNWVGMIQKRGERSTLCAITIGSMRRTSITNLRWF